MADPTAESFERFYGRLRELFDRLSIRDFAFTGGFAYGVWVQPRATRDADLCAVVPAASVDKLLAWHDGIRVGSAPMPTLIRFSLAGWDIDLFTAESDYYRACLARAVTGEFAGIPMRVVSKEDLLIHKLEKLRSEKRAVLRDADDIRNLVATHAEALDFDYLAKWLAPSEVELLRRAATVDPAALVAELEKL